MRTEASDEDAESPWPYEPKGSKRNSDSTDRRFRLKDGDLVYFKPARLKEIGEISLSSIWRGRVKTSSQDRATTHTFFEEVDKELLPFNSARDVITIAEQIFGFVDGTGTGELESALALAGRVYFSHGYIQGIREKSSQQWLPDNRGLDQPCLPAVTLKILDSPKPPSPALYFKDSKGSPRHIAKKDLKPGRHHPQGRKLYLHHRLQQDGAEPWRSKFQGNTPQQNLEECRFSQKMEITPLKAGAVFYFHIDFDNLSKRELGLLLYALKPSPDFRHKIGMGKPIGLGRINIEPVGVFPINRSERYTLSGFSAARHGTVLVAPSENPEEWPDAYRMAKGTESGLLNLGELQEAFSKGMDEDIKQALELLGNPNSLRARVHTPLVDAGEEEDEKDTFRWFVANDMGSRSKSDNIKIDPAKTCLEPLTKDSSKIPTLHGLPWAD
jgi:CRISPR-associated protein (TIGR03986 family)